MVNSRHWVVVELEAKQKRVQLTSISNHLYIGMVRLSPFDYPVVRLQHANANANAKSQIWNAGRQTDHAVQCSPFNVY